MQIEIKIILHSNKFKTSLHDKLFLNIFTWFVLSKLDNHTYLIAVKVEFTIPLEL